MTTSSDLQLALKHSRTLGRMLVQSPRSTVDEINLIMSIVRLLERLLAKEPT